MRNKPNKDKKYDSYQYVERPKWKKQLRNILEHLIIFLIIIPIITILGVHANIPQPWNLISSLGLLGIYLLCYMIKIIKWLINKKKYKEKKK